MTRAKTHKYNPHACAYLESIGLNPDEIGRDGVDGTGYWQFNFRGKKRIPADGTREWRTRLQWRSPDEYQGLLEAMELDRKEGVSTW